ncbi:MAG: DUF1990 domain-containing protein [Lewinellaceae bacterium]|nr:DUF1990 domain-containing protein [Lewinellaceae bacterium]MCB9288155.1 DUF1990 domain-containing protein [Lewinellaceae bacterium]
MYFTRKTPSPDLLNRYRKVRRNIPFSYEPENIGATARPGYPAGYDHDLNQIKLGSGEACLERAKEGILAWAMFPDSWTRIYPRPIPIEEGVVVIVLFRLCGLWWLNSCRIVYTFEENCRFGFAYGTLPGHVEQGEECFWVEMEEDGTVWYRIRAFSRPAVWLTKIGYPVARRYQRRFVWDSLASMQAFVQKQGS